MAGQPPVVLRYETVGRKVVITLDRPEAMNAFNTELVGALTDAIKRFGADDELLVAILTGAGGRAFSAGADLKEIANRAGKDRAGMLPWEPIFKPHSDAIDACPKPIIAAIDGYCLAGGFECALLCDIRLATRQSSFGLPEPRWSLLAGPGLVNLSRMIPLGEAFNMQLTGRRISAERAYDIGLIQELAEDRADLMAQAHAVADEICECAPLAVRYIKQAIKIGRNLPVDYAARYADVLNSVIGRTDDASEGPRAFAEKRKPVWKMR